MKKYYRNNKELQDANGETVEIGTLFERSGELLIMVDDDNYVSFPFNEIDFRFAFEEEIK